MLLSNIQEFGSKATCLFSSAAFTSHEITGAPWRVEGKDVATAPACGHIHPSWSQARCLYTVFKG